MECYRKATLLRPQAVNSTLSAAPHIFSDMGNLMTIRMEDGHKPVLGQYRLRPDISSLFPSPAPIF